MLWNIFFWLLPYILCMGFGAYVGATYSCNAWCTLTVSGICIGSLVYAKYAYLGGHKVGYMKGYTVGYTVGRTHNVELLAALHELWQIAVNLIHNMSFRLGLNEKAICYAKAEEMTAITIKQTSHQLQSIMSNLNHLSVKKTVEQVGKQVGSMLGFRAS